MNAGNGGGEKGRVKDLGGKLEKINWESDSARLGKLEKTKVETRGSTTREGVEKGITRGGGAKKKGLRKFEVSAKSQGSGVNAKKVGRERRKWST